MTLTELLYEQDGVLLRTQALEHLSAPALRHRIRSGGPWRILLPGVHVASTGIPSTRQRLRAALLYAGPSAVLAGPTAVKLCGLPLDVEDARVHVLVKHAVRPATHRLVVVRRTLRPLAPVLRDGLPMCALSRAVVDSGRTLDTERAVRALLAAAVQRRMLTVQSLQEELAASESAGSALVRRVVGEVSGGGRSAPEVELAVLFGSSRILPPALWNCSLTYNGDWLADPDAYFKDAGLVVESDSLEWHASPADLDATFDRHGRMEATGLHVLHFRPRQQRRTPAQVLAQVEQAYLAGLRTGPPIGIGVVRLAA